MIELRFRNTYSGLDYEEVYTNIPMDVENAIQSLLRNIIKGNPQIKIYINDLNKMNDMIIKSDCGAKKECCNNCKWYNKGIKNMAYCAISPEAKQNPAEDICDKYE